MLLHVLMDANDNQKGKFRRRRLIRKILKYLPRRASIHRYPILNRFADVAKKRSYLWSFRVNEVVPALYLGWILTFTPIPTVFQVAAAFVAAMFFRANVMVLMGLQLLSNAFTFLFLWAITHKAGAFVVSIFSTETFKSLQNTMARGEFSWTLGNFGHVAMRWLATMLIGALVLGSLCGFISSTIYKLFAWKVRKSPKLGKKNVSN